MGTTVGRQVLASLGRTVRASATDDAENKVAGITIDWATVTAAGSDTTLPDGVVIKAGQKGLPFGTLLAKITASGKYGPALSSASDGRQTWAAGSFFLLDETVLENPPFGFSAHMTNHPPVIDGGLVFKARLQVGGTGQPTLAQVLAVLPRLKVLEDA